MVPKLIFIYLVGSSLIENIPGAVKKAFGGGSVCTLCNATFGPIFEKKEWKAFRESLGGRAVVYHRNEVPAVLAESLKNEGITLPTVLTETDGGIRVLIGSEEIDGCKSDPKCLIRLIRSRFK